MNSEERKVRVQQIRESVDDGPCSACGDEDALFLLEELDRTRGELVGWRARADGEAVRANIAEAALVQATCKLGTNSAEETKPERRDEILREWGGAQPLPSSILARDEEEKP
jgi:hypothetical protein